MSQITAGNQFRIDMNLLDDFSPNTQNLLSFSAGEMTVNGGNNYVLRFTGRDFFRDGAGNIAGGIVSGYDLSQNGVLLIRITDAAEANAVDLFRYGLSGTVNQMLSGNDLITGTSFEDTLFGGDGHDNLVGGAGGDRLFGNDGNDHLFGQSANGGPDGNDTLYGGDGADYLQGNAGDDYLSGDNGSDRINGGQGNDQIYGGYGNDTVNGNLGNDRIEGWYGNDLLRGGQGNDLILAGYGDDVLMGDLGDDTLQGESGIDMLTGGAGADIFRFRYSDDDAAFSTANPAVFATDVILDFQDGVDRISLGFNPAVLLTGAAQSSATAALASAQRLFDANPGTSEVAAVQVGADTFLFWNNRAGGAIDSAVKLANVSAGAINLSDFI